MSKRVERDFYYDRSGNQIHEGDLLQVFHFRTRKKIYYMHHIVIRQDWGENGFWWAAKDYNREGTKGHYNLCAVAYDTGIYTDAQVIQRAKYDDTFKTRKP